MDPNNKNTGKAPNNNANNAGNIGANYQQGSKNNNQTSHKGNPEVTKKFQGHGQKEMKGIILQATLGGSKYVPNVGVSTTKLKRLSPMSFAPDPLVEEDYSKKVAEDKAGKPIYELDPVKKKVAKQMQE
eukprot:jgi/Psemu1/934/gm1.934_g